MNSSLNRGRRWTVVQARIEEGTLRNLQSSSESESDSGDDEGFGVEHHLDTFKVTCGIVRHMFQTAVKYCTVVCRYGKCCRHVGGTGIVMRILECDL